MKKMTLFVIAVISAIFFYACNGGRDKKAEMPGIDSAAKDTSKKQIELTLNCSGVANFIIDDSTAMSMMKRYDTLYKKVSSGNPLTYLSNSIWIDALIINSYGAFFESTPGKTFDGVRFVNGASNNTSNSRLLMVPTKPSIKPGKHVNVWGNGKIPLLSGDPTSYLDWESTSQAATNLSGNFNNIYRTPSGLPSDKNPLSLSVWMDKCVFSMLKTILEEPKNQCDGIMVYFGAYGKILGTIPGQFHANQSTIILVPTSSDGVGGHTPRWDIIKKIVIKINGALNHGELCPQQCDEPQ